MSIHIDELLHPELTPSQAWKNEYRHIPWNRYNLEKYRDIILVWEGFKKNSPHLYTDKNV